jgi:hypothetical protein
MSLLLPIAVQEDAERRLQAEYEDALLGYWTQELQQIDPYLSMVKVHKCTHPDLVPHCYHIRRKNPDGADSYWPLVDEEGERREPGAWMLEMLKANDMYNPRVHRSKQEAGERRRKARVRARELEAEQRLDEMTLAARAAMRMRSGTGFTKRTDKIGPKWKFEKK